MRRQRVALLIGCSSLLREGLIRVLRHANFRVIASGKSLEDIANKQLILEGVPLLVIEAGDGAEEAAAQIRAFKKQQPKGRVALFAEHLPIEGIIGAFVAGANVHFRSHIGAEILIKALELVMLGETILPPALLSYLSDQEQVRRLGNNDRSSQLSHISNDELPDYANGEEADPHNLPNLSPRESKILQHLAEGDSNKIIARKMGITEATVKVHVKAILRKIRVSNRTQAAIWAVNSGQLDDHDFLVPAPMSPLPLRLAANGTSNGVSSRTARRSGRPQ
jgi:DNA-binding NarL/FixJ family response regulator